MIFHKTPLHGGYLIDIEKRGDDRGFFARAFCKHEFGRLGLSTDFVQVNNSTSSQKGTLRGMHYQRAPHEEVKIIRCVAGAVYDVIVDVREGSPTYLQ